MTDFSRLWMFHCGSPVNYVIEAGDERQAMEVATKYCKDRGIRPPAIVRPMIVATPEILNPAPIAVPEAAVENSLMDKAKTLIGMK